MLLNVKGEPNAGLLETPNDVLSCLIYCCCWKLYTCSRLNVSDYTSDKSEDVPGTLTLFTFGFKEIFLGGGYFWITCGNSWCGNKTKIDEALCCCCYASAATSVALLLRCFCCSVVALLLLLLPREGFDRRERGTVGICVVSINRLWRGQREKGKGLERKIKWRKETGKRQPAKGLERD